MKSRKFLPAGIVLLLFILCFLLSFPLLLKNNRTRNQTEDEAFSEYTRKLFLDRVSSNTLTLHYTFSEPEKHGIDPAPASFAPYSSDTVQESSAALENALGALSCFTYEKLSPENQLTYDIMEAQLQNELDLASFPLYDEIFSPTLGTQAQLPVLLAEYTFRSKKDVEDYLALLSTLDTYYESLLSYQRERSKAGLFMADETADKVIAQCRDFISNPGSHFLLTTFQERIENASFLTSEEKQAYTDSNRALFFGHVIPAYELLIDGLSQLKGTGTNNRGLGYYEHGTEYYEALVACTVGTDRSIEEIRTLIQEQQYKDLKCISDILAKYPELLKTASRTMDASEPRLILDTLKEKMQKDFPSVSEMACDVKYVDPSLEEYLSPAFYLTPPLDCMDDHVIYINQAGSYSGLSLFTTLAHEGYPGHLYQTLYENSCGLNPVRNLFYFGGYVEGWATYAERLSYSYTPLDPDMAELLAANSFLSLGIYAGADVGIHYDGWSEAQTAEYLSDYGIKNSDTVHTIYRAVIEDPGNYLKYYLGAVEITKLKEQALAALPHDFVLKDFHEFLLSTGPAPFPVIEAALEEWLKTKQT